MEDIQKHIRLVVAIEPVISIHLGVFFIIHYGSTEWAYSGFALIFTILVFGLTYFVKIFEEKEDFPDFLARIRRGYFISILVSAASILLVTIGIPFSSIFTFISIVFGIVLMSIVLIKDISFEQLLSISELLSFGGLIAMNLAQFSSNF